MPFFFILRSTRDYFILRQNIHRVTSIVRALSLFISFFPSLRYHYYYYYSVLKPGLKQVRVSECVRASSATLERVWEECEIIYCNQSKLGMEWSEKQLDVE